MFKKIIALMLVCILSALSLTVFTACSDDEDGNDGYNSDPNELAAFGCVYGVASEVKENSEKNDIKIGCILIGDSTEGYTEAHIIGIQTACEALGIDHTKEENVIWKYKVPESEDCSNTARDLVAQGCNIIISNSYGHQDYMKIVAEEYPNVQFVAMTGDTAAASGLKNFTNAFTEVYQSRYVSGVVAGLKIKELLDNDKIPANGKDADGNVKVGYVGAYPYAEVVSGYTAFFLGIQSVVPNVVMDVQYTFEWYHLDKENEAAKLLMDRGCVIIGQHADSVGAPTAVQAARDDGKEVYSIGYNIDMTNIGDAVLTSATNTWSVCYEYLFKSIINGADIATNWTGGYAQGAVTTTKLGSSVAEGTEAKINETVDAIKSGTLHVFDITKFTVDGKQVTSAFATDSDGDWTADCNNVIADGYYHESWVQSAPSFTLRIDGITELNPNQN